MASPFSDSNSESGVFSSMDHSYMTALPAPVGGTSMIIPFETTMSNSSQPSSYRNLLAYVRRIDPSCTNTSRDETNDLDEFKIAPLFTSQVHALTVQQRLLNVSNVDDAVYPQYGLLGMLNPEDPASNTESEANLVFSNSSEPWSAFICGSQGSGKSHTLSCLLENSLIADLPVGRMKNPSTGMIFHYDKFSSFEGGQICEAAYLCSSGIPVRVLVAPTSYLRLKQQYANLPDMEGLVHKPRVFPLYFKPTQLSADIMMTLMAVQDTGVAAPLYITIIVDLLRQMALDHQGAAAFDFNDFLNRLARVPLTEGQLAPLKLRLQLLQSFLMNPKQSPDLLAAHKEIWEPEPGTLTIVDLSDQFIDETDACAMFSICLKLFMGGWKSAPRIIALDEAHKFLTSSSEATKLTTDLIAIIRQQRHLSSRVVIATQEPTVSGHLLDLCNVSIVHRFSSPQWYTTIRQHLAAAHAHAQKGGDLFRDIVQLRPGEALVFCPTAILKTEPFSDKPMVLQDSYFKLHVRDRLSADGGRSFLPSHNVQNKGAGDDDDEDENEDEVFKFDRYSLGALGGSTSNAKNRSVGQGTKLTFTASTPFNGNGRTARNREVSDPPHSQESSESSDELSGTSQGTSESSTANLSPVVQRRVATKAKAIDKDKVRSQATNATAIARSGSRKAVLEAELDRHMFAVVTSTLKERNTRLDPSGCLSEMLKDVAIGLHFPGDYLLKNTVVSDGNEIRATDLLKRVMKRYYDSKGIPARDRPDIRWLRC